MTDAERYWYKDAVIYQLHVRAFYDSNQDGVGDFGGLVQKLDYLHDLGVTALWLLPFYPSPLKDDGYDIAEYTKVHGGYGTLGDFRQFLREAHRRGMRVVTELVLNHTSDQHPWFQRARRSPPGSRWRNYYVWSDTPDRYKDVRIIFQDFEASNWSWDAVAKAHFWHRFYHHQPDLNWDNPEVREKMRQVVDFWLEMGVDGLRLDAVPYLIEREGTTCENLPETHQCLKEIRAHVDQKFPGRMLLAEANQWPEDAVAYFGNGDECHTAFHFPVMPRLFMSLQMEDRFPIIDILEQTPPIPESCQWVVFLRNHDELTLEMVTDEERDYMYRAYARDPRARVNLGIRRRLAPLVGNDRRKIELLNGLLMSLPGTPVIYYGDEIGMGDNIFLGDRNGVRTPMQWSPDRNAGFSTGNPQGLYLPVIIDHEYHFETINVETQQKNPQSLLWWMRRLIALRGQFKSFSRGTLEFLFPDNAKVLAFVRKFEDETILVVANLSRSPQFMQLDLSAYKNYTPVELFGRTEFPRIGALPYLLTLAEYSFYWFALRPVPEIQLQPEKRHTAPLAPAEAPMVRANPEILRDFPGASRRAIEQALPRFLRRSPWLSARPQEIHAASFFDVLPLPAPKDHPLWLALVQIEYAEGEPGIVVLPLGLARGDHARALANEQSPLVIAWLKGTTTNGDPLALYDAFGDDEFAAAALELISRRRHDGASPLEGRTFPAFRKLRGPAGEKLPTLMHGTDPSRSSVAFGDRLFFKLYRRIDRGIHPEVELAEYLTDTTRFAHAPPLAGALEYRRGRDENYVLGCLYGYVRNEGDAWQLAMRSVLRFAEQIIARYAEGPPIPEELPTTDPLELVGVEPPPRVQDLLAPFDESVELLGRRTAELHLALAANDDGAFAPTPFTQPYQRSLYQGMRSLARSRLRMLRRTLGDLPEEVRPTAEAILHREGDLLKRFELLLERKLEAARIRTHGNFHLGTVLNTGKDFVITDFAGEDDRPISERRIKRSPLRDVAGMLRSLYYAANSLWALPGPDLPVPASLTPTLERWTQLWSTWHGAAFLTNYFATAGDAFVPPRVEDRRRLLNLFQLEKALRQLSFDATSDNRWTIVSLRAILHLLDQPA